MACASKYVEIVLRYELASGFAGRRYCRSKTGNHLPYSGGYTRNTQFNYSPTSLKLRRAFFACLRYKWHVNFLENGLPFVAHIMSEEWWSWRVLPPRP